VINYFSKKCYILRYDRSADGEINLASFCSSGVRCSALGRLDLVHLHALSGVHCFPPPPPHSINNYTNKETSLFHTILSPLSEKHLPLSGMAFLIQITKKGVLR